MELLKASGVDPAGKEAVVLGRSDITSSVWPMAATTMSAVFTTRAISGVFEWQTVTVAG
jgi:5,10-methylene-tetrahydrofolate dehydrogenase/methenyl tetrahydrofolate cyclohydrolase